MHFSNEYQAAMAAVTKASLLCRRLQGDLIGQTMTKEDRSPVTLADYCSQMLICRELSMAFPDDEIIAEEHSQDLLEGTAPDLADRILEIAREYAGPSTDRNQVFQWIDHGRDVKSSRQWVLDPIDGTKGFLRGGQFAVALGLIIDGEVVLGVLGCPNLDYDDNHIGSVLGATKGSGAFEYCLDEPALFRSICVSKTMPGPELSFVEGVESGHSDHSTQDQIKKYSAQTAPSLFAWTPKQNMQWWQKAMPVSTYGYNPQKRRSIDKRYGTMRLVF